MNSTSYPTIREPLRELDRVYFFFSRIMAQKNCCAKCQTSCEKIGRVCADRFLKATHAKRRGLTLALVLLAVLGFVTTCEGMRGSEKDWTMYVSYGALLLHFGAGLSAARGFQSMSPMPWMFFSTFAGFAAIADILVYAFSMRILLVVVLTLFLYLKLFIVAWTVFFGLRALRELRLCFPATLCRYFPARCAPNRARPRALTRVHPPHPGPVPPSNGATELKEQDKGGAGLGGLLAEDPVEVIAKRLLISVSWAVPGMGCVNVLLSLRGAARSLFGRPPLGRAGAGARRSTLPLPLPPPTLTHGCACATASPSITITSHATTTAL